MGETPLNKPANDWKPVEIQIWTCAAHDYMVTRSDSRHRELPPECPMCGKPTIHSSPSLAQEILHRVRLREIKA
jgi:hypothetical protein